MTKQESHLGVKSISQQPAKPHLAAENGSLSQRAFLGHYWDSQKQWFSISSLEQQLSFAGQANRSAVNTTVFENDIYYSFR